MRYRTFLALLFISFLPVGILSNASGQVSPRVDLVPGPGSSNPAELVVYSGSLYFTANNGISGTELWRYESASQTASLVADIASGVTSSTPEHLIVYDGLLYFLADDGLDGRALWVFDGSTASKVTDIRAGGLQGRTSNFVVFDGRLFFAADDGVHGYELLSFDAATTTLSVVDIRPGPAWSQPSELTIYDNRLFFSASDDTGGEGEIWAYDPATDTASLIADVRPGPEGSNSQNLTVYDGKLYFTPQSSGLTGPTGLWAYDSDTGRAALVIDRGLLQDFFSFDGNLYLSAYEPTGLLTEYALMKYTSTGDLSFVAGYLEDNSASFFREATPLTPFEASEYVSDGENLYFAARGYASALIGSYQCCFFERIGNGREIWSLNASGDFDLLAETRIDDRIAFPKDLVVHNETLFFSADDGQHGRELFAIDLSSPLVQSSQIVDSDGFYLFGTTGCTPSSGARLNRGDHARSDGRAAATAPARRRRRSS